MDWYFCMHVRHVLTIHQMGTAAVAEILSTQRFQALSLLRNDVHLDNLYAPYNTCEPVDSYRKRFRSLLLCPLLCEWHLSIVVEASFPFSLGRVSLSVEGSKVVGVRKDTHTHTHIEGMERRIIVLLSSRMTKRARVTKHAGSASNLSDKTCCSDKTCHHRASLFIVSLKGVL